MSPRPARPAIKHGTQSLGHDTAWMIDAFVAGKRAFRAGRPRGAFSNYSTDDQLRVKWRDGWDWAKDHEGKG